MKGRNSVKFWTFVSDNIVALATVAAGIGVLIWQAIASPENLDSIHAAILGLLILLATAEIVESRKRLDRIQETVDKDMSRILAQLPTTEIRRFPDSEAGITYLSRRLDEAEGSIDFASIDVRSRTTAKQVRERLKKARVGTAAGGEVRFRYLFRPSQGRITRVKEMLSTAVPGKYFTAALKGDLQGVPLMPFTILDDQEVFARSPYAVGEDEVYVSITHPEVVALFSQWFNRLWATALKIDPKIPYEEQAKELEDLLQSES
jgi:tetrahydromethanopterin S-methyltransferase subunit G